MALQLTRSQVLLTHPAISAQALGRSLQTGPLQDREKAVVVGFGG